MKMFSALALTALLGTSAAFAANTAGSTSTGGTTSTSTAAPASTTASKGMSSKACNKQADEKKLTGEARTSFVKDCRAGKAAK